MKQTKNLDFFPPLTFFILPILLGFKKSSKIIISQLNKNEKDPFGCHYYN